MPVITRFSVYSHCNDLGGKVWNPAIRWTHKYAVFVVLENDQGETGLGECWCFDTAPDSLVAFLRTEIAPSVVGLDLEQYSAFYTRLLAKATLTARHGILASAVSGVDIAVWDMRSREAGVPLWAFIQSVLNKDTTEKVKPASKGQLRLYASGGLYGQDKSTDDLVAEMVRMSQAGFETVKMKIGGLSIADDIDRVHAVLDGLAESCNVIIDGVYSYDAAQAAQVYSALPSQRIEAFQSPVKASDLSGMRALTEMGVPVMATEAEYREEIHQQLLEPYAVHYFQTAPIACGGVSRLIELTNALSASGNASTKLSLEVSSTAIALLAAAHFAASDEFVAHTEHHCVHDVFFDELNLQSVPAHSGWFQLTDEPGLGMRLPLTEVKAEFSVSN